LDFNCACNQHNGSLWEWNWNQGRSRTTITGNPDGSPLLANVYLHYVFDLWVEAWRKKVAKGDVIVVPYAE